ncbi:MAG: MBL fold metallo-hydrolase [Oscillospiraceae bacterium]|jgi:phosphoribosyl 1,2-cyclic phosphate phosphodiesterase|nr:MBL fold metallo-hydrolase [Oscillospiraceae bacterium]
MDKNVMRMIGSGASEAIPNPMCSCEICQNARRMRGKEIRSRSCFRLNDDTQIDFGPDQFYQSVVLGNDLTTLKNILITHSHDDHLAFTELGLKEMAVKTQSAPLNIYMSQKAWEWYRQAVRAYEPPDQYLNKKFYRFVPMDYYQSYEVGGLNVVPLRGNHQAFGKDEYTVNYLVSLENGKTLYYACDTGYFFEETFEYLKDCRLDFLVIEGTFGNARMEERPDGHLGCAGVLCVVRRLLEQNTLSAESRVYITHINHKHTLTHEKMAAYYAKQKVGIPIFVGYDGMEIRK